MQHHFLHLNIYFSLGNKYADFKKILFIQLSAYSLLKGEERF